MAKYDLSTVGISAGVRPYRVAASATRGYVGEPINSLGVRTNGVADVNTVVVLTDGKPVIGTDAFCGIAAANMVVDSSATVTAQTLGVVHPIADVTIIRGKAKTAASVDTDSELLGFLFDAVLFDLTSTAYTIDEVGAADTSGLTIVNGDIAKNTLDVTVEARALRTDVA